MRRPLIFIIAIGCIIKSYSQITVYKDQGVWFTLTNNVKFSETISIGNRLHFRTVDFLQQHQYVVIETGVNYKLNKNICFGVGYLLGTLYPSGQLHAPITKQENRIWQNLVITSAMGDTKLCHRFIFEQRFKDIVALNSNDEYKIEGVSYGQRIRYRLEITTNLLKMKNDKIIYGRISNETRIRFGTGLKEPDFDQNNFAALLGYQLFSNSKAWVGYGKCYFKTNPTTFISNNILHVTLSYDIDLYKKKNSIDGILRES
ncbi:DUF2490 domain-containing protein [Mariniflexile sp.]|uniref:DUF2490 domain-containing protein n=1 Tax=Mariniflexile sp. TaxID=1979402 RepID=UPI00356A64DF